MPVILVTGATGTVGREVVAQLLAAGQPVRGMTRYPAKVKFDPRVEVVQGDFADADSLAKAVNGTDRVFSLALGPQTGAHERALAAAAKKEGVLQIVKLGAMGGDGETRNAIRRWHEEGEQAVRDSGIPWTVVRPGRFMSNALHWRESIQRQGKVFSNYGDGKLPSVHPRDIAAVAVRALTSEDYFGRALEVTGPVALSIAEEVAILSNALAKPIEFVSITDEAARKDMERANMPAYIIDGLLPFAEFVRSGKAARVFPTVEEVTGRPALSFAEWAREHAPAFQ
jgi:(4-alkanoyl-5-oxo-2,5-dihydrofuran-3-yl)methyl phosphate reductase